MNDCRLIESMLAPFVDGALEPADRRRVDLHLEACAGCRAQVAAQHAARTVLRARASQLAVAAPPGLRTRIAARASADAAGAARLGWRARLGAFAAAAALVLAVGAGVLAVVTPQWSVVLAAQLALDHLKCFAIDGDRDLPAMPEAEAEAAIAAAHGWGAEVPAGDPARGLRLVAVRECLYADGMAAHVLYRQDGQALSLFILPGQAHPDRELDLLGQASLVWSAGDRTYVLMTDAGNRDGLLRVAHYVRNEAR
ncbi:MAG: anti-sigma factor [Vicinamibacterales bacterium]